MSRRIALSVIAACAALSVTPAFADNDCFDPTTCPPAEETLAREQRMLEDRARELREQEAQEAAAALVRQRAEENRAQEVAAQEAAARAQAEETQRSMERAAQEQARRDDAAAARTAQDEAAHETIYAKEREAEEQRAAERRAAEKRAEEQAKMPNVIEPPAPVANIPVPPPAVAEALQTAQEPKAAKAPARQPAILSNVTGIVPPVSTVPPKKIVRPVERYEDAARPQKPAKHVAETPAPLPAPAVPPSLEEPHEPARTTYAAPIISSAISAPAAPVQIVKGGKAATVVVVRDGTYEDGVTPVAPNVRPDPAMKFCQTEMRPDGRYVYCNQASYHPYGANGYRPLGTYQAYRTAPGYITAQPGPRIISLNVAD